VTDDTALTICYLYILYLQSFPKLNGTRNKFATGRVGFGQVLHKADHVTFSLEVRSLDITKGWHV